MKRTLVIAAAVVLVGVGAAWAIAALLMPDMHEPGQQTAWSQEVCRNLEPPPDDPTATLDGSGEYRLEDMRHVAVDTDNSDWLAVWGDLPDGHRVASCEYSRGAAATTTCPLGQSYYIHPPISYTVDESGRSSVDFVVLDFDEQETC